VKHVTAKADILAQPDAIWSLLTEFDRWPEWGVSVTAVESDATEVAPGVRGRVRTPLGIWLPFVIGDVVPQSFWGWRVAGVPATGHYLEPRSGFTRVRFTVAWPAAPYLAALATSLRRVKILVEEAQ
jgi:hypothetical protein